MPQVFGNNASATIKYAISNTATVVSVDFSDAANFPSATGSTYFYATLDDGTNIEVVKVTSQSTNNGVTNYTVVRNINGVGAAGFAAGTKIEQRISARTLLELQNPIRLSTDTTGTQTFGFVSNRLCGGNFDSNNMSGTYNITYGTNAYFWDGSGTQTRKPLNRSIGGTVFGRGCMNFGWAEGGTAIGFGCMVGVNGANLNANGATALGWFTNAYRNGSFAAGGYNQAFGDGSTALGWGCTASNAYGNVALGEGCVTPVTNPSAGVYNTFNGCVAVGRFNKFDDGEHRTFSVGVGTGDNTRFTAFYVRHTGTTWSSVSGQTGHSGIGFPTLYKANRYNSDSSAGMGGVPAGELYIDVNGVVRMKL